MGKISLEHANNFRISNFIEVCYPESLEVKNYYPILKFEDVVEALPFGLVNYCKQFASPSPIQSQVLPIALSPLNHDVIGIAETGSGKTVAFVIPAISSACRYKKERSKNPLVLVLSPTRELAIQTHQTFEAAIKFVGKNDQKLKSVCIIGGTDKKYQYELLRNGADIVVSTPGRLLDFVGGDMLSLDSVAIFVLDEADRMLDLGFAPDVKRILGYLNKKRQTLMFSATWPMSIRKLALECMNEPIQVSIGNKNRVANSEFSLSGGSCIKQIVQVVENPDDRSEKLIELLRKHSGRIIVFVLYKKEADRVCAFLGKKKWICCAIHGDKPQSARLQALQDFKSGDVPILVATDVAARGLDIPDVDLVINYSFPLTIEDYVHRIGRTGRAGRLGVSYTLFTPLDKSHSGELVQVLRNSGQHVPADLVKFGTAIKRKEHKDYGAHYREIDPNIKASHIKFD